MPNITETPELERKSMLRDMDIPEVRYRNPDPEAGPRLAISEFRIQGLVEYPELGITREVVNKLVEEIRFELMQEGKLLPSGYSMDELGELSDLLVDIEDETEGRHVTPIEVQRLVWLIREQRQKRGITLGQIESIADKITRFYRERGFVLAKAYIPKQEVRQGIVTLTLLLGMLGDVEVTGNTLYNAKTISGVFDDLLTKPVKNSLIEEHLYLINDFPGLVVDGFFEPGYQIGDTKLTVNVKQEEKYSSNLRLDNHGTEVTGRYRTYADFQVNNIFGLADLMQLSLLQASSPSNTTYYKLKYQANLFSPRLTVSPGISTNQFVVDQSDASSLGIKGDVTVAELGLKYAVQRSRTRNHSVELRYENIVSDLSLDTLPSFADRLDEELKNLSVIYNFDILNEQKRRLHQGSLRFTSGNFVEGADINQDKEYEYLTADYTFLRFVTIPFFNSETRLIARASAQYSGTSLSSILKYSLAGPDRVRAFSSNVFTADDAIYLGADWIFNSPDFFDFTVYKDISFKDVAKPFIFVDYAKGIQHSLLAGEANTYGELSGAGIGLKFSHGRKFQGSLQIAAPVNHKFSVTNINVEEESSRVVFDFQYTF